MALLFAHLVVVVPVCALDTAAHYIPSGKSPVIVKYMNPPISNAKVQQCSVTELSGDLEEIRVCDRRAACARRP